MRIRGFCAVATIAAVWLGGPVTAADAPFRCSFDGPQLVWQLVDGRPNARLVAHGLARDHVRQGSGSERLTVAIPGGESLHFVCPVERFPVMDEFEARIWLRSNRPGAKLAVRVVLPRTKDAQSGAAQSLYVFGAACESPDRWEQLQIAHLPELLAAQVRVLRATERKQIDPREAYVDAVVLAVPGGEDQALVWTDLLEVDGVALAVATSSTNSAHATPAVFSAPSWPQAAPSSAASAAPSAGAASVQFRGTTLLVSGRPFLVRGVEWNDEPFPFLSARGFNTIWLKELPTPQQTADAARSNLWLICPPPTLEQLAVSGLGTSLDRVLAWNLGKPTGPQELDYFRRWASAVRETDALSRPILFTPRGDWLPASQLADALVAEHAGAASLTPQDFADWLEMLPLLARPGTPLWTSVATQAGPRMREHSARLFPAAARIPTVLGDSQIEAQLTAAVNSGCRGLLFQSNTPLDASDPATRRRAALVEQWNDRLELAEPWLTIGKRVGDVTSTDNSLRGIVLQAERARLFLPTDSDSSSTTPENAPANVALVIPGVPVSNKAYSLSPAGFRTLASERVAGGTRIELPRDSGGYVLLTEDASVVATYRQRVARGAPRAARVQYGLAAGQSRALADAARRLQALGENTKSLDAAIAAADAELKLAGTSLAASNFEAAYRQSSRAQRALDLAIHDTHRIVSDGPTFDSVPSLDQPIPFVARAAFDRQFASWRANENQLLGGDFEDLGQLRSAGWQHVEDPIPGIHTSVELSGHAPREGRYSLALKSQVDSTGPGPQVIARAPLWITSPPIRVQAGEVLEISGWIRIEPPIAGNIDALEIVDSLGGSELALRIRQTDAWQPFRLIRAAKDTANVTLTFALHGIGVATIDGVMARTLAVPKVQRLPTVTGAPGQNFPESARRPMSLQPAPR